ncbi:unnamed protein product [Cuscuta epithymum]|uniref:Uncharacterized protein n=1 Tax=Cuscuta epithymum TaxID=186058 RepID=A0AAV0ENP9_9ASTE|nr:unnamed protein product [Cuscuta epithymum]
MTSGRQSRGSLGELERNRHRGERAGCGHGGFGEALLTHVVCGRIAGVMVSFTTMNSVSSGSLSIFCTILRRAGLILVLLCLLIEVLIVSIPLQFLFLFYPIEHQ